MNTQTNRNGLCRLGLILALALCLPLVAPHQAGAIVSYSLAAPVILVAGQSRTWDITGDPCQAVWELVALEDSAGRIEFHKRQSNGSTGIKTELFDQLQSGQKMKISENNVFKVTVVIGLGKVKVNGECSAQP
jgi:hypothetical protein